MPTPLILDVDTGVDDMVALLLAVASPESRPDRATCVTGNVHVDMVTRNTSLVLELASAGGVEIARGASEPLDGGWQPFPVVHGPEGLGAYVRSRCERDLGSSAATLIAQEAASAAGRGHAHRDRTPDEQWRSRWRWNPRSRRCWAGSR